MLQKLLLIALVAVVLVGCAANTPSPSSTAAAPGETQAAPAGAARSLTVMTHDSFAISEEALKQFEQANQVKVQFVKSGDTGTALNKAILSRDNPLADVFYGVDNTFLSRALTEDIFEPYASPLLEQIPAEFKLDPQARALPVDYGDVCLNYDKAYFAGKGLPPPGSLDDLLKPEYKGLLVVQNPAASSPGLAFLLATIGAYGEDGYLAYWQALKDNDVLVVNDWESAYYTEFSGSSGKGPRPLVVSYNSSPVFEVIYAETPLAEPPTAALVADNSCFRQIEFVGLLRGARNAELGRKWIDFMLSPAFQQDMPMQMFVFPVNPAASLDETFNKFLQVAQQPVRVDPQQIAAQREAWLKAWTELMRQ
ncbi:MAG: thiamine ABC transporter substrate binding subunit [Chloroflexota bacterium]